MLGLKDVAFQVAYSDDVILPIHIFKNVVSQTKKRMLISRLHFLQFLRENDSNAYHFSKFVRDQKRYQEHFR